MLEDKLLIWRFNRGDKNALCRIYEKYKGDLLKVAAAHLRNPDEVEDVLHDVFVSFAQTARKFALRGSLKGYLAICIANEARDRNRAVRRQSTVALDHAEPIRSGADGPEQSAATQELAQRVIEAMARLPDEQREVILLHLQSQLRFRQIARLQGVSVNTIQSRYRYGMEKLRSIMNGKLSHEKCKSQKPDSKIVP
jgi:RNA polymerase sigma-70 factor, ECF subfamily